MLEIVWPYAAPFLGALVLTLVLTPLVREMNRRLGMVDKPDPRRINKVPIPRGGGLALVVGVTVSYAVFVLWSGRPAMLGMTDSAFLRLGILAVAMAAVGLADDKFSLAPKVKLLGQVVIAALAWILAGVGFRDLCPWLPAWLDFLLTVCWIVGAVNAFNLIDGLDGLASGLAFIATLGMAGALAFSGRVTSTCFYFAFAGGLLGFLRYNYNPASVFLGDCGSMFIGFTLAVMPICSNAPNSFLVSIGVPLLAMGVPIFDTSLAIVRRSIRHLIHRGEPAKEGEVMTADTDHIHHRLLRASGLNQRKAAWALYVLALFLVAVGLVGMSLRSRAAGLWLFAVTVAAVVIFRDMARVELFDAGRLFSAVARAHDTSTRRKIARVSTPFYLFADIVVLAVSFLIVRATLYGGIDRKTVVTLVPIRVTAVFVFLVLFNVYRTIWSRAMLSNYMRLIVACLFGAVLGSVVIYYLPGSDHSVSLKAVTLFYAALSTIGMLLTRTVRGLFRDIFYALDCGRLVGRKDVSRILVYGCGLRYRTFRRELVRTTAANTRIIVGLIDDNLLMRGKYIGGVQVLGTLMEAREIINRVNADAVVVACEVTPEWMKIVRQTLEPTGVKVTLFSFSETEVM
jgi:UDP-N-acetylmuramyl pentapeptide phosphotransferase/UDP-N-acetylglucosamine-1-phosphate transferase